MPHGERVAAAAAIYVLSVALEVFGLARSL